MPTPAVIPADSRPFFSLLGDRLRCLIDGAATGGQFAILEINTPPNVGPPPHIHTREDETFHVLEGEVTFWIDGKTVVAGPGTTVFAPRGVPHSFRNSGDKTLRAIVVVSPAGFEEFAAKGSKLAPVPPPPMPEFARLAAEYGIQIVPPK
jgi:mannose-6-phosphate isomerase-like protein (cupin superfamily)